MNAPQPQAHPGPVLTPITDATPPHRTAASLTPMQKRILEIIRLDLDGLLKQPQDKAYTRHNTDLMLGFIAGSNLAYADQQCPGFTDLLTHLQQIIVWQLRGQAPCTPAHNAILKELAEATNRALSQQIAREVEQEAFGHSDNRHGEART